MIKVQPPCHHGRFFFTEGHNFEPANRKQEFSAHEVGPGTKNVGAETP